MKRVFQLMFVLVLLSACQPERLVLLGTIEYDTFAIRAPAFQTITLMSVELGDSVQVGDPIAILDNTSLALQLDESEAAIVLAERDLDVARLGVRIQVVDQAREQLAQSETTLANAEREVGRQRQLRADGLIAANVLDDALARRDSANAAVRAAQLRVDELLAGARDETVQRAVAAVELARRQRDSARHAASELDIRAPIAGRIESRPLIEGDRPRLGDTIVTIQTADSHARFYIPQAVRASMSVGDSIEVSADGAKPMQATIRWIAREPTFTPFFALHAKDRGHLTYLAEADLIGDADLPAGFPIEVGFGNSAGLQ